ncbi:MFS transporter (macronuclear) [Tetrahymena thermophila SB210]|uniref:MFS transporter n=1 Tax=Tetrahymena thermophila (strain SB210) TaxID=312017 RepID=W7XC75_TETTS|nr:MFS transporter [Tetrahymena thermophila SB210]EWS75012.1 MFS transporter [Tetrahymena thermophila SB210]|eukprot:XP_012652470.1 MFS transporter [Tetrahymena thermophila SB210]
MQKKACGFSRLELILKSMVKFLCCRHWDFPSGPPPQYQPSLKALNFGVRMGSGVFTLVWPTTKLISFNNYL